jgi:hypothetical protein
MQFIIPQFIDVEDKIIGPVTLKQFLFLLAVGVLLFFLWYLFKLWFVILLGTPIVALAAALILVKVNGRPLPGFLKAWLNYWIAPRLYVWKKK